MQFKPNLAFEGEKTCIDWRAGPYDGHPAVPSLQIGNRLRFLHPDRFAVACALLFGSYLAGDFETNAALAPATAVAIASYFRPRTVSASKVEFKPQALVDYLELMRSALKEDGLILAQCLGGDVITTDDDLARILHKARLAPLVFVRRDGNKTFDGLAISQGRTKHFPVGTGVFVLEGHPLFERYYRAENYAGDFIADEPVIGRMMSFVSFSSNFAEPPISPSRCTMFAA